MLDASKGCWTFAIRASRELGLRLANICQLEWDCSAAPGQIVVWTAKRDQRVAVPTSPGLAEALNVIPVSHAKHVFPEQHELMQSATRLSLLSVQFTRLGARLAITGRSFHCLRDTLATEAKASGKGLKQIAQEMGYTSVEATKDYIHSNDVCSL